MTAVKDDLKHAFKGEMERADLNNDQYNFLAEFVLGNAYLLQELENIVMSYSKPRLEAGKTIKQLEHTVNVLQGDKEELFKLLNEEKDENERLHNRNKRLSKANNDLDRGISRAVRELNSCDHIKLVVDDWSVKVESLVKLTKHEGMFKLACTKCGKKF